MVLFEAAVDELGSLADWRASLVAQCGRQVFFSPFCERFDLTERIDLLPGDA
jgi:hypothetical protein